MREDFVVRRWRVEQEALDGGVVRVAVVDLRPRDFELRGDDSTDDAEPASLELALSLEFTQS